MIRKICFALANYIYHKEKTTHAERHGYYYILELFLSQIFEILLILFISILLKCFLETFVILITFIVCRSKIQGYHAHKMKTCVLFSTVILVSTGLISKLLSNIFINILRINCINYINIPYFYICGVISILLGIILTKIMKNKKVINKFQQLEKIISEVIF